MSLPLIQINGKCEVPFYFVCICQKCYIINVINLIKKKKQRNKDNLVYVNFMLIYVNIIK